MVQWLRLCTSNAGGMGSIPVWKLSSLLLLQFFSLMFGILLLLFEFLVCFLACLGFFLFLCLFLIEIRASQEALVVKNLPANAGDTRDVGSVPGRGRSPGGGNGYPLQYSSLTRSPMD